MEVDDFLPLSALAHVVYCERRAALVHVDGVWAENAHTTVGRLQHERVDAGGDTCRPALRILRRVPLRSERLRLHGFADVVEVHGSPPDERLYPVEHKKGGPRADASFQVQLCAQAMALEEMAGTPVPEGALYLGKTRRRAPVRLGAALREKTERAAERLHELVAARLVPAARLDARCADCSLRGPCAPEVRSPRGALLAAARRALSGAP